MRSSSTSSTSSEPELTIDTVTVSVPALSGDGRYLAFQTSASGVMQVHTVDTCGGLSRVLVEPYGLTFHEWLPYGHQLLYGCDPNRNGREGLYLIDLAGSSSELLPSGTEIRC